MTYATMLLIILLTITVGCLASHHLDNRESCIRDARHWFLLVMPSQTARIMQRSQCSCQAELAVNPHPVHRSKKSCQSIHREAIGGICVWAAALQISKSQLLALIVSCCTCNLLVIQVID